MSGLATWIIGVSAAALAVPGAAPAPVTLCTGQIVQPTIDGRLLGHLPYDEAAPSALASAPAGFGVGQPCLVQREMLPDLQRLLNAAAADPSVGRKLKGVSCFRSDLHQHNVFCGQIGPKRAARDAADRARSVAPPAFSEHATGYAIDFAQRPAGGCADVSPCIATSAVGRWLLANAPTYGFELSFPAGNIQGVTYEPWHWRWVGTSIIEPGAAKARLTFSHARAVFPATPYIMDRSDQWLNVIVQPPAPAPVPGAFLRR